MRKATLCYLRKDTKILLTLKKRGFGEGKLNGFGGKSEEGETLEECIVREGQEEVGITIQNFYKVAILEFIFPHNKDWDQEVHVYFCNKWKGEPKETEEVAPAWIDIKEVDYSQMWPDDIHWLPMALDGELIKGKCKFDANQNMISHTFTSVFRLE